MDNQLIMRYFNSVSTPFLGASIILWILFSIVIVVALVKDALKPQNLAIYLFFAIKFHCFFEIVFDILDVSIWNLIVVIEG